MQVPVARHQNRPNQASFGDEFLRSFRLLLWADHSKPTTNPHSSYPTSQLIEGTVNAKLDPDPLPEKVPQPAAESFTPHQTHNA